MALGAVKLSRHHILPTSRRGKTKPNNLVFLYPPFHTDWHLLFEALTQCEIKRFIATLHVPGSVWDQRSIRALREWFPWRKHHIAAVAGEGAPTFPEEWSKIWQQVFEDLSWQEAIEFIDEVMVGDTHWPWIRLHEARERIRQRRGTEEERSTG